MNAIVVGCGRVGSALARKLAGEGWSVAVVDKDETSMELLPDDWRHPFVVGHALDTSILEEAGIESADVFVAATGGDNTNVVVAQVAKGRYGVEAVAARRSEEHTSELQSHSDLVCRLLLEKKKTKRNSLMLRRKKKRKR